MSSAATKHATAAREPELQFARSEAKYRGLLEAAPDAMVVVDEAGAIVLVNVQTEKQFGYPRDELIGRKVTDIIPSGFAERIIADGSRSAAEALAQVIGTGIELVARRKDGGEFPIEIMLSPLESADGVLVTAAIRDISRRKAAEQLMIRAEQRYRGLLEAAPDAMVVVSQTGEIVLVNVQTEELKRPDVVILDCTMEQVSGIVALRQIRASATAFATPVLILTARCGARDEDIAWQAGADDYLRKPFDPEELVMRVEALVAKHAAMREFRPETMAPNGTAGRDQSHPR